jgi:hypothetical protein
MLFAPYIPKNNTGDSIRWIETRRQIAENMNGMVYSRAKDKFPAARLTTTGNATRPDINNNGDSNNPRRNNPVFQVINQV